jgi:long-chain acyl-CoA synthetase
MGLYENVASVDASILAPDKRFVVNGTFEDHGVQPWEALFDGATDAKLPLSPAPYKPAVLINTSGTTGQPKFVIHTPETLSESVGLMIKNWGFSDDNVMVMPLPMAHLGGLMCFLSFIQVGAPFILLQGFDADTVLDCIERHRCTTYVGFRAHYAALLESQLARPCDLESLRICFTGADTCPIDLQERVTSTFGAPLYNIWAATEVFGNLTFGLQQGPVVRVPKDAQIRLVDENGMDVADGEIGETRLASYKVPEGLRVVDEFPRNALSKVDRNMLQAMAAAIDKSLQMGAAPLQPKQPDEQPTRRVAGNR